MNASVIIRSKDEADRLRLTLTSLACQTAPVEVVVVNDGSTDHTDVVLDHASEEMPIVRVKNEKSLGRSGAANVGAEVASGDILIFLDGDTLAAPDLVDRHLTVHSQIAGAVARGETYHLRSTRFFADPESGSPRPGEEKRIAAMSESELGRMRVTRQDIRERFDSIFRRAQPGVYPGAGPRHLFDLEMDALRSHPDCGLLWAAASGSNQSVGRKEFLAVGGFDRAITINEHRELALRLCQAGLRMVPADEARTFHVTHRTGWRDPATDTEWEGIFYNAHPIPDVALLAIFWASLTDPVPFPDAARIMSFTELEAAANRCRGIEGIQAVREAHLRFAQEAISEGASK